MSQQLCVCGKGLDLRELDKAKPWQLATQYNITRDDRLFIRMEISQRTTSSRAFVQSWSMLTVCHCLSPLFINVCYIMSPVQILFFAVFFWRCTTDASGYNSLTNTACGLLNGNMSSSQMVSENITMDMYSSGVTEMNAFSRNVACNVKDNSFYLLRKPIFEIRKLT